jgi:hypothetical protein
MNWSVAELARLPTVAATNHGSQATSATTSAPNVSRFAPLWLREDRCPDVRLKCGHYAGRRNDCLRGAILGTRPNGMRRTWQTSGTDGRQSSAMRFGYSSGMSDVSRILSAIERGNRPAADELLPLVYQELIVLMVFLLGRRVPLRVARDRPRKTLARVAGWRL